MYTERMCYIIILKWNISSCPVLGVILPIIQHSHSTTLQAVKQIYDFELLEHKTIIKQSVKKAQFIYSKHATFLPSI